MRLLQPLLLLLLALWLSPAAGAQHAPVSPEPDAAKLKAAKHAANGALARSDYKAAVAAFTELIQLQPADPDSWFRRATTRLRLQHYASAVDDLDRALELERDSKLGPRARAHRARSLLLLGRCAAARADYATLVAASPGDAKLTEALKRAEQCQQLTAQLGAVWGRKDWTRAKALLDQLLGIAHASHRLLLQRAEALLGLGMHEEALVDTRAVLQTDKTNLEALELGGRAYYLLQEWEVAGNFLRQGLKLSPEHKGLKAAWKRLKAIRRDWALAQEEFEAGHWSLAVPPLQALLAADPQHRGLRFDCLLRLCQVRTKLRQGKEAVEACSQALAVRPQDFSALLRRSEAHLMAGNYQDAINDASSALQQQRGSQEAQEALHKAQVALKKGSRKDHYATLGVAPDASLAEIKKAFRKLALQFHPDKVAEEDKEQAEMRFREIGEAYEVLADEELRRRYDAGEDIEEGERPQGGPGAGHPFAHFFQQGGFPGGGAGGFHFRFG